METLNESEQISMEESDKNSPAEEDTGWDRNQDRNQDRNHTDALLDVSEENFFKEQEQHEYHCLSGWEEAVQGWSSVSPLACIYLPQKRGKKPKTVEPDHHCLLCVDMSLADLDSTTGASEYCHESRGNPQDRGLNKTMPTKNYNHTTDASAMEASECSAWQKTTQHLREKTEEAQLKESLQPSSPLQPHHLTPKYPALKNRQSNVVRSINSFTVLPPVSSPQLKPQRVIGPLCNGRAAPGHGAAAGQTSEADSVISAREGGGVERGEDTRADIVANLEPPKDTRSATLTSTSCTYQQTHHLFSALAVSVPRRYEVPFISIADTMPSNSSYSMGRHLKLALRTSSGYSRNTRAPTPQLPILLGTKVPMPASAQRLL